MSVCVGGGGSVCVFGVVLCNLVFYETDSSVYCKETTRKGRTMRMDEVLSILSDLKI